jgi:hypothetical protein
MPNCSRSPSRAVLLTAFVLAVGATACTGSVQVTGSTEEASSNGTSFSALTPAETPAAALRIDGGRTGLPVYDPTESVPTLDPVLHQVPLENVVFDTFDGRFVPLPEASSSQIARLRDAIQPIYDPQYDGPEDGAWLREDDLVIGYVAEDEAYAYPIKMLNLHEILNDFIDGVPVLVSYCPLCASGGVYVRRGPGSESLVFGNTSALYENDLVMFDHLTGSYWYQVEGKAIAGTLSGARLELLPSLTVPWKTWRVLYPETRVLSRDQGFARSFSYDRDPFSWYPDGVDEGRFPFPLSVKRVDDRIRASTVVLTVRPRSDGTEKAYSLERANPAVINDVLDGAPVVVFVRPGPVGAAYSPILEDGRRLTFGTADAGSFRDIETASAWGPVTGWATAGPLTGTRLTALPTRRAFWFAISVAMPGIELDAP